MQPPAVVPATHRPSYVEVFHWLDAFSSMKSGDSPQMSRSVYSLQKSSKVILLKSGEFCFSSGCDVTVKYVCIFTFKFSHQNSPLSATERHISRSPELTVCHREDLMKETPFHSCRIFRVTLENQSSLNQVESSLPIAPVSFPLSFTPGVPQTHQVYKFSSAHHLTANQRVYYIQWRLLHRWICIINND